jgi:hypothetical protein
MRAAHDNRASKNATKYGLHPLHYHHRCCCCRHTKSVMIAMCTCGVLAAASEVPVDRAQSLRHLRVAVLGIISSMLMSK